MTHTTLAAPIPASLSAPVHRAVSARASFWLGLSLLCAAIYGVPALVEAFASPYVVQDDVRVHVFWMQRFVDPDLFPDDLIANYFQSVAPAGYTALYRAFAWLGVEPLLLSKLLPVVLGLVATAYCFGISLHLLPSPVAAFASSSILNQSLWLKDDLISATPRAFLYPLFLGFVYYVLRGSLLPALATIVLQGLFYPQFLFISAGVLVLRVVDWKGGLPRPCKDPSRYRFCAAGLGVALVVLALYALRSSEYGPVMTAAEARTLPQFERGGRTAFFVDDPVRYWITQSRSGVLPPRLGPPLIWASLLLPILWLLRSRFPLAGRLAPGATLLWCILAVSLAMFLAAHALLFKLHLPSRYTEHTLRIVMALAAGIALTILLDAVLAWGRRGAALPRGLAARRLGAFGLVGLVGAWTVLYPGVLKLAGVPFPYTRYVPGEHAPLYEFFAAQPKGSLVASVSDEINNVPAFAGRPILVAEQYAVPFHLGYYRQIQERSIDLIRAQYSSDLKDVGHFLEKYGVAFLVVRRGAFERYYLADNYLMRQFRPVTAEVRAGMERGARPALRRLVDRCAALRTADLIVLGADCIVRAARE